MDFYTIIEKSKRYYLEEDTMNGVALSSVQLGVLADRLSSLYQKQQQLELAIRTYITVYYSNGTTEYISLKQRPSLLLSSARVTLKYGSAVTLDGFAATFLDGEEENRVWFGDDGAVENRGESKEKTARLLRMMVEALNEPEQKEDVIYTAIIDKLEREFIQKIARQLTNESYLSPVLELNQTEISFLFDEQMTSIAIENLSADNGSRVFRLPLLAKHGYYQVLFDLKTQKISLIISAYAWENPTDQQEVTALINQILLREGNEK